MRNNLLVLLALVCLLAVWAQRPQPRPAWRLHLILSGRPINPAFVEGDCFSLTLENGLAACSMRCNGTVSPTQDIQLTPAQLAELQDRLELAGARKLGDVDSGQPEKSVLYTLWEMSWGSETHRSNWRGLPPTSAQSRCARVLLHSPLGGPLQSALAGLKS